jgi:hypothetical protein
MPGQTSARRVTRFAVAPRPCGCAGCLPLNATQLLNAYPHLYGFHHEIYTRSPEAQRLFDAGMMLSFNFNERQVRGSLE